jgi:hypothetical protein
VAFYAGKGGNVAVGAVNWKLREWSLPMNCDIIDTTNFLSGGFRENIAGLVGADMRLRGPYDAGSMAMTVGNTYSITLLVGGAVTFAVTARIENVTPSVNVEGAAEIEVSAKTTGTFAAAIT